MEVTLRQFDPLISLDAPDGAASVGRLTEDDIMRLIDDGGNSRLVEYAGQW